MAAVAAALLAACGDDEQPADNAVEAQEQNVAEVGGVRYRVILFREVNVRIAPGDALWKGKPPGAGSGLYAVVLEACGAGEEPTTSSGEIRLEDAFGERYEPRSADTVDEFEYASTRLAPRECHPKSTSAAERTWDGGVLVYEVPFDSIDRPMILEIADPTGGAPARIRLDL